MPVAVIALDFDPVVRVADRSVRLESIVIAAGVLVALLLAARLAARAAADGGVTLRPDDLLYLALSAVPGAVVGGRVGYGLVHLDYYAAHPGALLDPGQGGLQLGLGIVGGALTVAATARLLGEPVGRWLDLAALPALLAIAAGKVGAALGGTGQGIPADLPWATAYVGPGPWGSLGPAIASHPSQLYEAAATAALLGALAVPAVRARIAGDGSLILVALAGWSAVRIVVGVTFRESPAFGPLRTDQLIAIGILAASLGLLAVRRARREAPVGRREDSARGSIVGDPGTPAPGSTTTEG
ncbi:MAG TPA: prolipoprotein diacylglyceryl transferase family protein [Candidatus Limnocylindrales bacterium]